MLQPPRYAARQYWPEILVGLGAAVLGGWLVMWMAG